MDPSGGRGGGEEDVGAEDSMFASYLDNLTKHLEKYGHGQAAHALYDDDDGDGAGGEGQGAKHGAAIRQQGRQEEEREHREGEAVAEHTGSSFYRHHRQLRRPDPQETQHSGDMLGSHLSPIQPRRTEAQASRIFLDDDLPAIRTAKPADSSYTGPREGDSGLEDQLDAYRQRDAIYQDELSALHKENSGLQQQVNRLRGEVQKLSLELREADTAREKVRRLERYLKTVPTAEEFEAKCDEVEKLKRVEEHLKAELRETQTQGHVAKQKINEQEASIHKLQREVQDLRRELLETGEMKNSAVEETRSVLRQVTKERDEARRLYERVSKELSSRVAETKSLQQKLELQERVVEEQKHQTQLRERHIQELQAKEAEFVRSERQLRASLTDADDVRESLLRKLSSQATTIRDLREAIDALSEQNQTLVSQNQMLRSGKEAPLPELTSARYEGSEAQEKASGRMTIAEVDALQDELGKALQHFARVFDLALARLNNSDDDTRRLLGLSAQREAPLFVRTTDVSSRLECVREMERFVERLESGISDAYARDVGHQACGIQ